MAINARKKELKKGKTISLFVFFALQSAVTFGQFNFAEMYQGWFPRKDSAPPVMHRLAVDLVFNRWMEEPTGVTLEPYSIGINVYRMIDIPFTKKFGISLGPGFSSENYHHNGQFITIQDTLGKQFTSIEPFTNGYEYKRNKISLNYFDIPFELRFRSAEKPRFSFYPGFKVGYLFNAHTKTIDNTGKYKNYNIPNLNSIRYGVSLRMGWGNAFHIYAYYQLTGVFEENKGVQINPFSIGFTFYLF